MQVTAFTGVYNADGGLRGEAAYVVGHLFGRAHCSLCDVTHSPFRRKRAWDEFAAGLDVPIHLSHANEIDEEVRTTLDGRFPGVVAHVPGAAPLLVLGPEDLEGCDGSVDAFRALLADRVASMGLVPVATGADLTSGTRRWPWLVAAAVVVAAFAALGFIRWSDAQQERTLRAAVDVAMTTVVSTEQRLGATIDHVAPALRAGLRTEESRRDMQDLFTAVATDSADSVRAERQRFAASTEGLSGSYAESRDAHVRFLAAQEEWYRKIGASFETLASPATTVRQLRLQARESLDALG